MQTVVAVVLVLLAVVVLVAVAKAIIAAIIIGLGAIAALYLWNRYGRRSSTSTGSSVTSSTH